MTDTSINEATGVAVIDGATFSGKRVGYAVRGDLAVFEGDIVLGTVEEVEREAARRLATPGDLTVAVQRTNRRWRGQVIPYEIGPGLPNPQRVSEALGHWMGAANLVFMTRTASNAGEFPDYVRFVPSDGCRSAVGRSGGMQEIELDTGCLTGHVIHEIGHALGLWHEQSREDRDAFVTIPGERPVGPGVQRRRHHIVYTGMDRHIHELFDAGEWRWNPVSAIAGAPQALTDPFGYQGPVTQHIVYTSTDHHVVELFVDGGGQWQHNLLDLHAGSPAPSGAPRAYVTSFGDPHHVVYRGEDGHVHELFDAGGWRWNDLTAAAGAPGMLFGDAVGFVDETQHVVFRSPVGEVVELYVTDDRWRRRFLTRVADVF